MLEGIAISIGGYLQANSAALGRKVTSKLTNAIGIIRDKLIARVGDQDKAKQAVIEKLNDVIKGGTAPAGLELIISSFERYISASPSREVSLDVLAETHPSRYSAQTIDADSGAQVTVPDGDSTYQKITHYMSHATLEKIVNSVKDDRTHFLSTASVSKKGNILVYGTAMGQRLYAVLYRAVQGNPSNPKAAIDQFYKTLKHTDKTIYPEVSNFWLKDGKKFGLTYLVACFLSGKIDSAAADASLRLECPDPKKADEARFKFAQLILADSARSGKTGIFDQDLKRDGYTFKLSSPENRATDLTTRRACKSMLETAFSTNQPVVYALDGLNLLLVANRGRVTFEGDISKYKVPICTSEIRFLFREWDKYQGTVGFYHKLTVRETPWGPNRAPKALQAWASYALHLLHKLIMTIPERLSTSEAQVNEIIDSFTKGDWLNVINGYHQLEPSKLRFESKSKIRLFEGSRRLSVDESHIAFLDRASDKVKDALDQASPSDKASPSDQASPSFAQHLVSVVC
ncbi:MAG: hypothetical protein COB66_04505 [Coxiella sp. (in: Bacteria)]|nr:MAG: hypothetical protein COB66_04505 [Coxiella sp. (in: g-proteobacteria)]